MPEKDGFPYLFDLLYLFLFSSLENTPKKAPHVPVLAVMQALKQCELFIDRKENIDVDMDEQEVRILQ